MHGIVVFSPLSQLGHSSSIESATKSWRTVLQRLATCRETTAKFVTSVYAVKNFIGSLQLSFNFACVGFLFSLVRKVETNVKSDHGRPLDALYVGTLSSVSGLGGVTL